MIPVAWANNEDGSVARGFWDQTTVEAAVAGTWARPPRPYTFAHTSLADRPSGAVIPIPARWWTARADELVDIVAGMDWAVVVLCGDEEATFPWDRLAGLPHCRLWVQTPKPGWHDLGQVFGFGDGPTPNVAAVRRPWHRPLRWSFAGQIVDNIRRQDMRDAVSGRRDGAFYPSVGFGQGLGPDAYSKLLARTQWVLAPSGPATCDTFRAFEALHAGAVPIVDDRPGSYTDAGGYWRWLFPDWPGPVLNEWDDVHAVLDGADWGDAAVKAGSWWQRRRRDLTHRLHDDIEAVGPARPAAGGPADWLTVVVATSPIGTHPDPHHLDLTLQSLDDAGLAGCETLIFADGVRPEQEPLRAAYQEYLYGQVWSGRPNTTVCYDGTWRHQAGTFNRWAPLVRTPFLLFMEHDTPLKGTIPWEQVRAAFDADGGLRSVRFHHENEIPDVHEHMMAGPVETVGGLPLRRTVQWSQRPHVARTDWYRNLIRGQFPDRSRTMIEDLLHGVFHSLWTDRGQWAGLSIYHPDGGICRSWHSDGRGDADKYRMDFG